LREWIAEGRATAQTRVQSEGSAQWKPLTEYLEFAVALAHALPPRPAPGPIYLSPMSRTNPMAMAALVMGILAMTCCLCCCGCCYGLPFNVLGVIFALVALSQIRNDPQSQQGRGLAIAGLVLCLLSFAMAAATLFLGLAMSTPDILRKVQRL
jgi:hypothetical protein